MNNRKILNRDTIISNIHTYSNTKPIKICIKIDIIINGQIRTDVDYWILYKLLRVPCNFF